MEYAWNIIWTGVIDYAKAARAWAFWQIKKDVAATACILKKFDID
jgi:hypothetical protein